MKNIEFEKIIGTNTQIESLFELLKDRRTNISHCKLPSKEEHAHFVKNHGYREWFTVKSKSLHLGSFYLKFDNSIGFNFIKFDTSVCNKTIQFIMKNFRPLPPIPSHRNRNFHIHISPNDIEAIDFFIKCKFTCIQNTYEIVND